jgi:hypothetical protein
VRLTAYSERSWPLAGFTAPFLVLVLVARLMIPFRTGPA